MKSYILYIFVEVMISTSGIEENELRISLDGKVVVITGAESGIGRSIALACAEAGAAVCAAGLVTAQLDETARMIKALGQPNVIAHTADISDETQVARMFDAADKAFGRIDAIIANAGIVVVAGAVHETSLEQWRRTIDVNLTGTFLTVSAGARYLVKQGQGGSILATGSSTAVRSIPNASAYIASKGGVHALMQAMALELGPHKIRVNTIVPGQTNTPPVQAMEGYRDKVEPGLPLRQIAEPDEMGRLVAFAISDAAPHMTGAHLKIDSGRTIA
jgi:NAD(P)-dependent dehydrogenase (short-subunit alcohol dehydrogenase family)